jgi:hypothetical protein
LAWRALLRRSTGNTEKRGNPMAHRSPTRRQRNR